MKPKRILASVLSVALLLQLSPLNIWALDEDPQQPPQVSTVQENIDPTPVEEPTPVENPAPAAEPAPVESPAPTEEPAAEEPQEPTAAQAVQALIDALPDEVTDDNAEAVEQALTDIDDAKESLTDDELAGLDLTRYDAAANALLALWGEAPADEVETLDNYQEPGKDATGSYYQITNENDLRWFAQAVNGGQTGINAILVDDITLDKNTQWTPIGTETNPFTGKFDGCDFTIHGLYINKSDTDYVGLFGYVGENGTVKDVTLKDSYVSGNECVGGICGRNKGGTVQGCRNTGTVSGAQSVGGVCGENLNSGIIQKCDNAGTVSGTGESIGGVCGVNAANLNYTPTIQECYNTGTVSGTWFRVGGVCGNNNGGTVKKSYNTGTVSGEDTVGGVCGGNEKSSSYSATVNGCYNTGTVSGTNAVGGVCGYNQNSDTVTNCYYLAGTSANAVGRGNEGTNCVSKTELQFQNGEVAYLLQKDLNITTQVWGQRIDGTGETDDHPVLNSTSAYTVHPAAPGSICKRYSNTPDQTFTEHAYDDKTRICSRCGESKPLEAVNGYYEIYNQDQLREFANLVNTTSDGKTKINACLMNDITMDSTEWTPIGTETKPFAGKFDGNGKTITGLKCTDKNKNYVGLVGYANGATIQDVTVKGSNFNGNNYIGAVCGFIVGSSIYAGTITGCTNSGSTVKGWRNSGSSGDPGRNIGGIVGRAKDATVQRCVNTGKVSGINNLGGIVGCTEGATVQDCGNTSNVKPNGIGRFCGGIAGSVLASSRIHNCYNTDSSTADKIYGDGSCSHSNCYYLANDTGSTDSTDKKITAKTQAQFASGEVAFLLQGDRPEPVWGQTLTGDNKQDYPVLGGAKVYQGTPCTGRYSNTPNPTLEHNFDSNNYCTACGAPHIAYTVTIPATVELGNAADATATISADVTLPTDKTLKVTVNGPFTATLDGTNDVTAPYTIQKDGTVLKNGDSVLTAENGQSPSIPLTFVKPDAAPYAGSYTGKVTFTVSVGSK